MSRRREPEDPGLLARRQARWALLAGWHWLTRQSLPRAGTVEIVSGLDCQAKLTLPDGRTAKVWLAGAGFSVALPDADGQERVVARGLQAAEVLSAIR